MLNSASICLFLVLAVVAPGHAGNNSVLILNNVNIHSTILIHEIVVVDFYMQWCEYSQVLAPEYEKTANYVSKLLPEIIFAKMEVTGCISFPKLEFGTDGGIPKLVLFLRGMPFEYSGYKRKSEDIVKWLLRMTGLKIIVDTVDTATAFIEFNNVATIGFFRTKPAKVYAFIKAAENLDDYNFAISTNYKVFKEFDAKDGNIIMFRKFDAPARIVFDGDATKQHNIEKFIIVNASPPILEVPSLEIMLKIFSAHFECFLFLFAEKSDESFNRIMSATEEVAIQLRGEVLFVFVDSREEYKIDFMRLFDVQTNDLPTARFLSLRHDWVKHMPKSKDFSAENIGRFIHDSRFGVFYQKGQKLPPDWDRNPVKILVSSNFNQVAFDETKYVLVMFYTPLCAICKKLEPIFEQVGQYYRKSGVVIVAKIDISRNHLKQTTVVVVPQLKLYVRGTSNVNYLGPNHFPSIIMFVNYIMRRNPMSKDLIKREL